MFSKRVLVAGIIAVSIAVPVLILLMRVGAGSAINEQDQQPPSSASAHDLPAADAGPPPNENSAEIEASLPLFHRLNDNYMRGAQPARGGVSLLKRLGVKTIVDLRSAYDVTDDARIAAESVGLRYSWMPMSVWDPPSDEETNRFLGLVKDDSQGPFFVFCADGFNRTGEMSAIYRIAHDRWSAEQALKEMDDFGFSPYYYTLRNYVWSYARKFRPAAVPRGARR
ncbi:MAG TPA: hypothetical protein VJH03_22925 [Blastocatellia bacterium]|nr:hypothetical protein [Blastocatellia bacterium]